MSKWSVGFSVNPMICATFNTTTSNAIVPGTNQSFKAYNDSIKGKESYRLNVLSATFWFNYSLNRKWEIQAGIGYMEVGFQRNQTNIKFDDQLYPGIGSGKLEELTSVSRNIDYNYRFQYLHLPLLFNYHIKRSGDFRINYSLTGGLAVDVLLKHKMTANLDFDLNGQHTFNIDSTGYNGRLFALNIILGGRIDYKIDKKLTLMVQPVFGFYPISVSSVPISVYPFYFTVHTGLVYEFAN